MDAGSGGKKDARIIDKIMLRFRPIAPRPETGYDGSPNSGRWKFDASKAGMAVTRRGRKKRKYVRVRRKNSLSRKNTNNKNYNDGFPEGMIKTVPVDGEKFVKLQLAPEGYCDRPEGVGSAGLGRTAMFVDTWVTVERVISEGSLDMGLITRTGNLEKDTCPIFVTDDGLVRVEWVNEAYRRMVGPGPAGESSELPEVRVRLGIKEGLGGWVPTLGCCSAFTCWVRLEYCYTWRKEGKSSRMVPCDVWRMMEFGRWFAWRMDVKAALGLGL